VAVLLRVARAAVTVIRRGRRWRIRLLVIIIIVQIVRTLHLDDSHHHNYHKIIIIKLWVVYSISLYISKSRWRIFFKRHLYQILYR
jgi:hypothetical protein